MSHKARISVPDYKIQGFCERHHIRKLAFFGSVLRDDFDSISDVDVLVEFEDGKGPGLFRLAGMEMELSHLMQGRKVDMNTPRCLSRYFRNQVVAEANVQYAQT